MIPPPVVHKLATGYVVPQMASTHRDGEGSLITPLARATRGRGLPSLDARSQGANQAALEGSLEDPTSLCP